MNLLGEKIFSFPKFYDIKVAFLKKINGLSHLKIDHLIQNKEIIDIGCGSKSLFYNPKNAKRRTGIDLSPEMIEFSKKNYPNSLHYVGPAEKLPFPDKSFDIALIQFVLHHIEANNWHAVITEAKRVSKDGIIIFDQVKHDGFLRSLIQKIWWDLTDGGQIYRKERDWVELLKNEQLQIINYQRLGTLFGNVCFYQLKILK